MKKKEVREKEAREAAAKKAADDWAAKQKAEKDLSERRKAAITAGPDAFEAFVAEQVAEAERKKWTEEDEKVRSDLSAHSVVANRFLFGSPAQERHRCACSLV